LQVEKYDLINEPDPLTENSLWKPEENNVRPRVLTRLKAFIDVASKSD
jgi:hypothetical protein